ncbi:MAG TPA: DUF1080 domain-containing protein [Lacipirellula sp.]
MKPASRLFACLVCLLVQGRLTAEESADWRPLFNGTNLDGWETWLGPPRAKVPGLDLPTDAKGRYTKPVGLNIDPTNVYSVVEEDGAPAIRISGQIYGAITSLEEFENYHLRLEMKWGKKKWPPRENRVRDSGLLYHCTGEHGGHNGVWMKSFECQIQEGDTGDFWPVGGTIVDVEGEKPDAESLLTFRKGAPLHRGVSQRIVRNPRSENPTGEWNTVEIYVHRQTAAHVCEGKTNMILTGLRHKVDGREQPLTRGKLQIQSEGAEVFYRDIEIRPIDRIPDEILLER